MQDCLMLCTVGYSTQLQDLHMRCHVTNPVSLCSVSQAAVGLFALEERKRKCNVCSELAGAGAHVLLLRLDCATCSPVPAALRSAQCQFQQLLDQVC